MDAFRAIAVDVLDRFNQFLLYERRARYVLTQWNYRFDVSRDEEPGHLPDRSVRAVDESEGVIAIVGRGVPPTTRLEIRRVYELRRLGQWRSLWFLADRSSAAIRPGHVPLDDLLQEIIRDFGAQRIYNGFDGDLDFQARLMMEIFPFLVTRTGDAFGRLGEGAA